MLTPLRMFSFLPGDTIEKFLNYNSKNNELMVFTTVAQLMAKFHNIMDSFLNINKNNNTITVFKKFFPLISFEAWSLFEREFNILCKKKIIYESNKIDLCQNIFYEFKEKVLNNKMNLEHG